MNLVEDKRYELISKSKNSPQGNKRFKRRNKSRVASTVKSFNSIDMNKLFKEDILTVNVPVQGETDDYVVCITFGGFLEILRDQLTPGQPVDYRALSRACIIGFNRDDVFINCTCPDFRYRFGYFATRNKINSGAPEIRPSNITNPDDSLGSACKHVLLVLSNSSWILRVSRVVANYIRYMEKHYQKLYADLIYPAIYGVSYQDAVQMDIDNEQELDSSDITIDAANDDRVASTRFQRGNTKGVRFASSEEDNTDEDQIALTDNENPDDQL